MPHLSLLLYHLRRFEKTSDDTHGGKAVSMSFVSLFLPGVWSSKKAYDYAHRMICQGMKLALSTVAIVTHPKYPFRQRPLLGVISFRRSILPIVSLVISQAPVIDFSFLLICSHLSSLFPGLVFKLAPFSSLFQV